MDDGSELRVHVICYVSNRRTSVAVYRSSDIVPIRPGAWYLSEYMYIPTYAISTSNLQFPQLKKNQFSTSNSLLFFFYNSLYSLYRRSLESCSHIWDENPPTTLKLPDSIKSSQKNFHVQYINVRIGNCVFNLVLSLGKNLLPKFPAVCQSMTDKQIHPFSLLGFPL